MKEKNTRYFIFGNDAVSAIINGESYTEVKENYNFATYKFTEGDDVFNLLAAFNGWGDFMEITYDNYKTLSS